MTNIAIFYHVGQIGNWQEVYLEQMNRLTVSGILSECKHFHIGINGTEPLPFIPENAHIEYNQDHILEADTLKCLWQFSQNNPDYKALYFHTKGVTRVGTPLETVTRDWRYYLEYFCIDKWQRCIQALDEHDTCSVLLRNMAAYGGENPVILPATYYDGNFWWANTSYIATLDPMYMYVDDIPWLRGKSELWIGTGNPRAISLHDIDYINPYDDNNFNKEKYMSVERKAKIVMIAMFKNEAPVLRRMLDSTLGYCDYYVMQNNGSTDGSEEIARQFLDENNLQGEIYFCEEGWQGFGWNRDHLIRYCQEKVNHGCDWILKMDCDEILEVDDNFDWRLIEDYNVPGFHITAVAGTTVYHRCWMWNARMPWGFNHDPCHETIYHQEIGEGFLRVDLPQGIRQIGLNEGQSWSNPTKFVTDALTLEEKMISEGDMLEEHRQYHFWYIGKSYYDAHECHTFPLGQNHKREYARRAIWYFAEWIKHVYRNKPPGFDESAYNALIFSAEARRSLNEWEEALTTYKQAEVFAPIRNDHLIGQIQCYEYLKRYDKMLEAAIRLNDPARTNPFPHSASFINNEHYVDTGTLPARLLKLAHDYIDAEKAAPVLPFYINTRQQQAKRVFIVDNFYANPDEIRNYALTQVEYEEDNRWYKGLRSKTTYRPKGLKESFEHIMGHKIVDFESSYNGVFQIMRSHDPQVYHYDTQRWAGMIYLSPNAPIVSGTRLHRSNINGTRHRDEHDSDNAFQGEFYDSTKFEITDSAANIYNRLLIMDAGSFHSAGPYFGNTMESGRLTHLFFFD